MNDNIPKELKEVFEAQIRTQGSVYNYQTNEAAFDHVDHERVDMSLDDAIQLQFEAYTLGQQGRDKEIAELKRQIQTQAKHKDSIKGYWLSCSEAKKKWTDAIQEFFDGEHTEIKTLEEFKYQFDLD